MTAPKRAATVRLGTYSELAVEYYDPARHPTSANFRQASKRLVREVLNRVDLKDKWICDVGCGESLVAEILDSWQLPLGKVILCDSSESMLEHSRKWRNRGARALRADAHHLPFADRSIAILVASLGDPFDDATFWSEASRVAVPTGLVVYTTPSHDWASDFRARTGSPDEAAEFITAAGPLLVPSIVPTRAAQQRMMVSAAFDMVLIEEVRRSELGSSRLSPKLVGHLSPDISIVTCFVGQKRSD